MSRDLRKYASQTTTRLILGGLILLLAVGAVLIYFNYGIGAAVMGILCILGGLVPILLIILVLNLMEWIVRKEIDE
ncbi:MAG TPA: hypothetical protein PKW33_01080 [Anaerolineaceae bacterium]|nr:hypothetical protein [Anaerolineaceae bacterium]HPN50149.1 hypothetical protein [Anaerolineaceae bacterium]